MISSSMIAMAVGAGALAGPAVLSQPLLVACRQANLAKSRTVGTQLVGYKKLRSAAAFLSSLRINADRGLRARATPDEEVSSWQVFDRLRGQSQEHETSGPLLSSLRSTG